MGTTASRRKSSSFDEVGDRVRSARSRSGREPSGRSKNGRVSSRLFSGRIWSGRFRGRSVDRRSKSVDRRSKSVDKRSKSVDKQRKSIDRRSQVSSRKVANPQYEGPSVDFWPLPKTSGQKHASREPQRRASDEFEFKMNNLSDRESTSDSEVEASPFVPSQKAKAPRKGPRFSSKRTARRDDYDEKRSSYRSSRRSSRSRSRSRPRSRSRSRTRSRSRSPPRESRRRSYSSGHRYKPEEETRVQRLDGSATQMWQSMTWGERQAVVGGSLLVLAFAGQYVLVVSLTGAAFFLVSLTKPSVESFWPFFENWFKTEYFARIVERRNRDLKKRARARTKRGSFIGAIGDQANRLLLGVTREMQANNIYDTIRRRTPVMRDFGAFLSVTVNVGTLTEPREVTFWGFSNRWELAPYVSLDFEDAVIDHPEEVEIEEVD